MNNYSLNKKIIFIVSIVVSVIIILVSRYFDNYNYAVKSIYNYTIIPIQKAYSKFVTNSEYNNDLIKELKEENNKLKNENTKLEAQNSSLVRNNKEYTNLLEINNLKDSYSSYDTYVAKIISKENNSINSKFTINKGENDGIKQNMNVVVGEGLVGIVEKTYKESSVIRPIINNNNHISAVVETTKDLCVVNGYDNSISENRLTFNQMNNNDNSIITGTKVLTSEISDLFYPGLVIGYITYINVDSNNLSKSGYIMPAANFEYLDYVLIISSKED